MSAKVGAPGVVKLLGEHAVVYGKTAVAAAINIYASAEVTEIPRSVLHIKVPRLDLNQEFTEEELTTLYSSFSKRKTVNDFIEKSKIDMFLLPYATIASRMLVEHKVNVLGNEVTSSSEIQPKSGLASSSAAYTAFTCSLLKACGKQLSDREAIELARDGDRIMHLNDNAGLMDVSTSYYGGYVSSSSKKGVEKVDSELKADVVIIDTGPKKSTAEMVSQVRALYDADKVGTEKIFDEIEKCTDKGIAALKKSDLEGVGRLMYSNHTLLQKIGVSTERLDKAVEVSMNNGAFGAKLSGGGGGGVAIAFAKNPDKLIDVLKEHGFKAYKAQTTESGAREQLK